MAVRRSAAGTLIGSGPSSAGGDGWPSFDAAVHRSTVRLRRSTTRGPWLAPPRGSHASGPSTKTTKRSSVVAPSACACVVLAPWLCTRERRWTRRQRRRPRRTATLMTKAAATGSAASRVSSTSSRQCSRTSLTITARRSRSVASATAASSTGRLTPMRSGGGTPASSRPGSFCGWRVGVPSRTAEAVASTMLLVGPSTTSMMVSKIVPRWGRSCAMRFASSSTLGGLSTHASVGKRLQRTESATRMFFVSRRRTTSAA
mmetsp:Transcript_51677/g.159270  ORF Transcript_51677/g.159270 Transcript_51677/m.159270 type:complete len:259 (+) Transcript_51677:864-1640(+)